MRLTKWSNVSRAGCAVVLATGLMIPAISSAAVVSGSTTTPTAFGDITVDMTIDDITTAITITYPDNHWVGINYVPPTIHTSNSYALQATGDGSNVPGYTVPVVEVNSSTTSAPVIQASQDLFDITFTDLAGGLQEISMKRASNTGDSNDYLFTPVPQAIALNWALGGPNASITQKHVASGAFLDALVLVPVPAALPLLASGLFVLGLVARRRKTA